MANMYMGDDMPLETKRLLAALRPYWTKGDGKENIPQNAGREKLACSAYRNAMLVVSDYLYFAEGEEDMTFYMVQRHTSKNKKKDFLLRKAVLPKETFKKIGKPA